MITRSARVESGFTLIELIAVIVILGIVAIIGTDYVIRSVETYHTTVNRADLINRGRQAIERMTRQVRGALPNSVRVVSSGGTDNCLEFLPIAGGGNYVQLLPDQANGAPGVGSISPAPYSVTFGSARYVSVGAFSAAEITVIQLSSPL